jgi:hypothetical protein
VKRISLLVIAGGILAVVAFCTEVTSPDPSQELSQVEQLKKEVASLRQRVEALEEQLKDHTVIAPKDGREMPIIIRPPWSPQAMPKGWRRFEFNGVPYYVVPIERSRTIIHDPEK